MLTLADQRGSGPGHVGEQAAVAGDRPDMTWTWKQLVTWVATQNTPVEECKRHVPEQQDVHNRPNKRVRVNATKTPVPPLACV